MDQEKNQNETASNGEASSDSVQVQECRRELEEWRERCLRVNAEFENYKKREIRERQTREMMAQQVIILPLLTIVDNFERAIAQQQSAPEQARPWLEGVGLIAKELEKFLEKIGVRPIEQMDQFNPEFHEAVAQVTDSKKSAGSIVTVFEKGYLFKGAVIRPARVSVAA